MKRLNYLVNGLAALALIVLFSQCTGKADNQTALRQDKLQVNLLE